MNFWFSFGFFIIFLNVLFIFNLNINLLIDQSNSWIRRYQCTITIISSSKHIIYTGFLSLIYYVLICQVHILCRHWHFSERAVSLWLWNAFIILSLILQHRLVRVLVHSMLLAKLLSLSLITTRYRHSTIKVKVLSNLICRQLCHRIRKCRWLQTLIDIWLVIITSCQALLSLVS
jgi:hypothetical protein